MILKFIFVLCLFFSVCESSSVFKAENISLVTKKVPPLMDVTVSGTLKINQGDKIPLTSSKSVENVYFVSKNIDIEKENEKAHLHEQPTLVEVISTKAKNMSLHRPPVNQTTMGGYHRLKSINFDAVGQSRDKDNGTSSSSTRYTKMTEAGSTKTYAVQRMVRAKPESVQSVLKKIFPDNFFGKKHNSDSDGSRDAKYRNRNSSRRQKIKNLGAGRLGGEAVYFRAENQNSPPSGEAEISALAGAETSPPAGAETHPPAAAETSPPAAAETSPPAAAETSPTAAAETSPPVAAETHPPAGAETHAPAGAETSSPGGAETHPLSESQTSPTGGAETPQGQPVPPAQPVLPGENKTGENQGNATTSVGQQVNYHYHYHYFGGVKVPALLPEATTTQPPT